MFDSRARDEGSMTSCVFALRGTAIQGAVDCVCEQSLGKKHGLMCLADNSCAVRLGWRSAFEQGSRVSKSLLPPRVCNGKGKQDARGRGGRGGLLRLAGRIRAAPCWPTCADRHGGRRRGHAGHSTCLRGQDR